MRCFTEESTDRYHRELEEKEKHNEEIYNDLKAEFEQSIIDCIEQGRRDELEVDDMIEAMQNALDCELTLDEGIATIKKERV